MTETESLVRVVIVILAALLLLPVLVMVLFMPMMGMWGGHMWNGGMWNGGVGIWVWLLSWLGMLAILFGLGYLLFRGVNTSRPARPDPAVQELRTAYARGELSDEEYEERLHRLREGE